MFALQKNIKNVIEATDPLFQSFHTAVLCIGSFNALLFTGCCINELRRKNYQEAAITAAGALVFIAATFAINQAGPKLLSAPMAYLLTPYCPFDPIESQIL